MVQMYCVHYNNLTSVPLFTCACDFVPPSHGNMHACSLHEYLINIYLLNSVTYCFNFCLSPFSPVLPQGCAQEDGGEEGKNRPSIIRLYAVKPSEANLYFLNLGYTNKMNWILDSHPNIWHGVEWVGINLMSFYVLCRKWRGWCRV